MVFSTTPKSFRPARGWKLAQQVRDRNELFNVPPDLVGRTLREKTARVEMPGMTRRAKKKIQPTSRLAGLDLRVADQVQTTRDDAVSTESRV